MAQRPRGPKDMTCPLHRKPMADVCDSCPLWVQLRGKLPQTEQEVDEWFCSLGLMPALILEGNQMQRQTGAAIESLRNAFVEAERMHLRMIGTISAASGHPLIENEMNGRLIESGDK